MTNSSKIFLLIGPDKSGARLEASKNFAKAFLTRHNIPTAAYRSFDKNNAAEASDFLRTLSPPYVIKADGLAAGKGVVILDDIGEAGAGSSGNAQRKIWIGRSESCY